MRGTGTAVEINSRPERLDPPEPLLTLALSLGLRRGGGHRRPRAGPARVAAPRLRAGGAGRACPADRVMNTLPLDDFLAWTAGHAA